MAYSKPIQINSWEAAVDLSTAEFLAVKLNGSTKLAKCAAGEASVGIVQNKPASGKQGDVITAGVSKAIAGAAFGDGDLLTPDANGKLVKATGGDCASFMALDDASGADAIVPVLVLGPGGASPIFMSLSAGAEAADKIVVTAQAKLLANGQNVAEAVRVRVKSHDAGATLTDDGSGSILVGSGTVEVIADTAATGELQIGVTDVAAETVYVEFVPEKGVPTFIALVFA